MKVWREDMNWIKYIFGDGDKNASQIQDTELKKKAFTLYLLQYNCNLT